MGELNLDELASYASTAIRAGDECVEINPGTLSALVSAARERNELAAREASIVSACDMACRSVEKERGELRQRVEELSLDVHALRSSCELRSYGRGHEDGLAKERRDVVASLDAMGWTHTARYIERGEHVREPGKK